MESESVYALISFMIGVIIIIIGIIICFENPGVGIAIILIGVFFIALALSIIFESDSPSDYDVLFNKF